MRPLELRLRNFRSYFGEDTVFDFRGRRLVGIVGPIGAGKSSILDAMSFALYGRTPTVARSTTDLIHQRADGATVAFRFEVEGQAWEAVRAMRRKGQSQHALYRLDRDVPDSEKIETYTQKREVDERIEELLGLDFDAFSRSVLLAQGRFSEFLRAPPRERDRVLKGVFGHDRIDVMRGIAKEQVARLSAEIDVLVARLHEVEKTAALLEEQTAELRTMEQRIEAMRKAQPEHDELGDRLARVGERIAQGQKDREKLDAVSSRFPDRVAAAATVEEAVAAGEVREALAADLAAAQADRAAADKALQDAEDSGIRDRVDAAASLLASQKEHMRWTEKLEARVAELEKKRDATDEEIESAAAEVAASAGQVEEAAALVDNAAERLGAAEEELHGAQQADMAATLRSELAGGDVCPVCEQVVAAVPDTRGDSPLADLEGALRRASAERQAAEKALAASQGDLKAARASLEAAEKARAGIDVELAASRIEAAETTEKLNRIGEELAGLVGEGDAAVQVERLKGELKTLAESAAQASRRLNVVLGQHNEAIQRQQNAGKEVAAAGMALVEVAAWLGLPAPQIDDSDPTTMTAALDALAAARTERAAALDVELAEARTERDDAESARRALLDELGIEDDFKAALAAEEARAGMLSASVATNRERVETMGALAEQCDSATARLAVFERLVGDLTDSRFIRFLLDDERRRLADLGSDHFQRLSSGRYRFSTDGKFDVVDLTAADAVRRADSLSGGETFLASLGLALALAEMVSRSGGRLEAFFLDEGFGTLDPEHLDLAMEGVELLAAGEGSRLVVVVSHVPELRHRLEDLIVLDKSPLTGDTRVVRS